MQFYLGSRWSRREELCDVRTELNDMGHEVTSRWLDNPLDRKGDGSHLHHDTLEQIAVMDFEDLIKSDCVVIFTENDSDKKRGRNAKGGFWVEFGIAIALNKRTLLVGPKSNAFCYMPLVGHYEDTDSFLDSVEELEA